MEPAWLKVMPWIVALAWLTGCASPTLQNPFAAHDTRSRPSTGSAGEATMLAAWTPWSKKKAEPSRKSRPSSKTDKSPTGKTQTVAKTPPAAPKEPAEEAESEPAAETEDLAEEKNPLGGHDAVTQALIEAELRDAAPAERTEMLEYLKSVPREMVPGILTVRRNAVQHRKRETERAEQTVHVPTSEAAVGGPAIQPATSSSPPQSGLGNRSPWDRAPATRTASTEETAPRTAAGPLIVPGAPATHQTNYAGRPVVPTSAPSASPSYAPPPAHWNQPPPGLRQETWPTQSRTAGLNPAPQSPPPLSQPVTSAGQGNPSPNGFPQGYSQSYPVQNQAGQGQPGQGFAGQNSPPQGYSTQGTGVPVQNSQGQPPGIAPPNNAAPGMATTGGANNPLAFPPGIPRWGERIRENLNPGQFFPNILPSGAAAEAQPTRPPGAGELMLAQANAQPLGWNDYLQQLISVTAQEVVTLSPGQTEAERQFYIERHVYLRMLYLMAGQQERALQYIPAIDPADQEFWQQVFWGLANYFEAREIPNPADRAAQTVAQFNTAILRLKEKANLELKNVNFCHTIASFGNYERYPRDEFGPGQEVLLYAELNNFHSELTTDARHRTLLRSWLEIRTPGPDGKLVERIADPGPSEDLCRNHRRDYFLSYRVMLPQQLTRGQYVLQLTVEDQLSRKLATHSLNFTVN